MISVSDHEPRELLKSPNWDKYCNSEGFIEEGFPFGEGFPNVGPLENVEFTIIFRSGERLQARVDFSTQYMAEGLSWLVTEPSEFRILGQFVVAGWCELPAEEIK